MDPKHVLVAEDDAPVLRLIQVHLECAGFKVSAAADGRQALEMLNTDVDLFLVDSIMPAVDGFKVVEAVREQPAFDSVPIILMGALRNDVRPDDPPGWNAADILNECRLGLARIGVDDYIVKPFNPAELVALVRSTVTVRDGRSSRRYGVTGWTNL